MKVMTFSPLTQQIIDESMQRMAARTIIENPATNKDEKALEAIKLLIARGYTKEDINAAYDALERFSK